MTGPVCPLPEGESGVVEMAHGGGGRRMHQLIAQFIRPILGSVDVKLDHDGAILDPRGARLAFTTDTYVVRPLFFPGGDIGSLAVNGTVNDLAMCGARPDHLSVGLVLEEGLPLSTLRDVLLSMRAAAEATGVRIVTGDTKVVERGKGDGLYINTAGVGALLTSEPPAPDRVRPGDAILLSGDIGRHGVAVLAAREGFDFEGDILSDSAPVADAVARLFGTGIAVHCLRDPTRGGLAATLIEIAEATGLEITIDEAAVAVSDPVRAACEVLGLDPLHVANEGRFVCFVPEAEAERALAVLRHAPGGEAASIIGRTGEGTSGRVKLKGRFGNVRMLDMPSGEQLPRIC